MIVELYMEHRAAEGGTTKLNRQVDLAGAPRKGDFVAEGHKVEEVSWVPNKPLWLHLGVESAAEGASLDQLLERGWTVQPA